MSRILPCLVVLAAAGQVAATGVLLGTYSSITESDCYAEMELFADGTGEFRDICSAEGQRAELSVVKTEFSWQERAGSLIASFPDSKKTFVYHAALSCESFGYRGSSPALVSGNMRYFKLPLDCK